MHKIKLHLVNIEKSRRMRLAVACRPLASRPLAGRTFAAPNVFSRAFSEKSVIVSADDAGFATLTLDRPKVHNASSDVVIGELSNALDEAASTPNLRGLFVKANGKSFSAGGDLGWMKRAANYTDEQNEADALALSGFLHRLSTFPAPTIALVQGAAFGGGVGLISAVDIAVGVAAKFMLSKCASACFLPPYRRT